MRKFLLSFVSVVAALFLNLAIANGQSLQMGISVDIVPVGSDFNGTDIVVFGSIEDVDTAQLLQNEYFVIITVRGADEDVVIRKKDWVLGLWINRSSHSYSRIPSFYSVISDTPVAEIADIPVLKKAQIGIDNLLVKPESQGNLAFLLEAGGYSDALRRIRVDNELFAELPENLDQLSPTLFRATVPLPANVPIGQHIVTSHLFSNGELLATKEATFRVQKIGFGRWMFEFAHGQSLLYGLMAVFVAIFTGWAANAIFRKS